MKPAVCALDRVPPMHATVPTKAPPPTTVLIVPFAKTRAMRVDPFWVVLPESARKNPPTPSIARPAGFEMPAPAAGPPSPLFKSWFGPVAECAVKPPTHDLSSVPALEYVRTTLAPISETMTLWLSGSVATAYGDSISMLVPGAPTTAAGCAIGPAIVLATKAVPVVNRTRPSPEAK